jgi:hypothetical protein
LLETTHFINDGYGWVCKHCSAQENFRQDDGAPPQRARFLREGEAEEKEPVLSTPALARWRDAARQILVCPRCQIEELINQA